jgi:hypothetical protein
VVAPSLETCRAAPCAPSLSGCETRRPVQPPRRCGEGEVSRPVKLEHDVVVGQVHVDREVAVVGEALHLVRNAELPDD